MTCSAAVNAYFIVSSLALQLVLYCASFECKVYAPSAISCMINVMCTPRCNHNIRIISMVMHRLFTAEHACCVAGVLHRIQKVA